MAEFRKKRDFGVMLGVFLLLGTGIAAAVFFEEGRVYLRFFWGRPFLRFLQGLLIAAFGLLVWKRFTRKPWPQRWLQWIYGIAFLPVVLLPVFRCYFKVPYVFCRACPHPCPWGILRVTGFPAFLLLNLSNRSWCTSLCPFGTFQECQTRICAKRFALPSWVECSAWILLLLTAGVYLLTLFGSPWTEFFEMKHYAWVETTLWAAAAILVLAFFIPKFWCRYFCPVGTIAEWTAGFRRSKPLP